MKVLGVGLLALALALLMPRNSFARGRMGEAREVESRKAVLIRIGIGLAFLAGGFFLVAR
jgi:hypothetical protein